MMPRLAVYDDLASAAALLDDAGLRGWTAASLAEARPDRRLWLSGPIGRPAGVALAQWLLDEGEILAVAVEPTVRRRGVGRRLLEALIDDLTAAGVRRIFLEVRAQNGGARALYRAVGFTAVGRRVGFYGDDDAVIMARPIDGDGTED